MARQLQQKSISDQKKSIAILPVKPINAADRNEIYEIGIADSLINWLSLVKGFSIRPLSATYRYRDIEQDPISVGKEQRTDYVLASNYQLAGGKIRITAQLFNVASGQIEETYKSEKDADSVFAMQDAIAGEIGNILFARIAAIPRSQTTRRGTTNEEAYRLYLQGKNLTARRNPSNSEKAIEYFEQAVLLDPNFARGYVGLAQAYTVFGQLNGMPRKQYKKALEAINKALNIDNNLAEGYAVRADLKLSFDWDFAGMESDLDQAGEIEPNSTAELLVRAKYLLIRGRFDEAVAAIDAVLEIDPASIAHQYTRGRYLYKARHYDEAILQLKRIVEADENFVNAYGMLHQAYEKKGDYAAAFDSFMGMIKRREPENIEFYQKIYEEAGWQEVRRKFIEIRKYKSSSANEGNSKDGNSGAWNFGLALVSAEAGEKEQAFEFLYKAVEDRPYQMLELNIEPSFDSLRDDPRFDDLLRRVGLK